MSRKTSKPSSGQGRHGTAREAPAGSILLPSETPALPGPFEREVNLKLILEPELPAREAMSEEEMVSLMESVSTVGLLYPLLVIDRGGMYEISDGHRRFIAAQRLGWQVIRCRIFPADGLAVEAAKVAANLEREDWNPAQEAIYYKQLVDKYSLDEAGLCALVKRSADYIGSRWKLLLGDTDVFECLREGKITLGVAQQLNRVPAEMYRKSFLDSALRGGAGARIVRGWVEDYLNRQITPTGEPPPVPATNGVEPPTDASLVPAATLRACALCGGYRDSHNLTDVTLHTWEWESILKMLRKAEARSEAAEEDK